MLPDNSIEVEGATAISESLENNNTLTKLLLGCNEEIERNDKIKLLNKNETNCIADSISNEGAIKICESLMDNKTLTELDLSSNDNQLFFFFFCFVLMNVIY